MGKTKKYSCLLFLILSLIVITIDYDYKHIDSYIENTESSESSSHSNSMFFEDNIVSTVSDIKTNIIINKVDFIQTSEIKLKNNLNTFIWQPPKLS